MKNIKRTVLIALLGIISFSNACDFIFVNDSKQAVVLVKPVQDRVEAGQDWAILVPAGQTKKITGAANGILISVFQQKAKNQPLFELTHEITEIQCADHEITLKYNTLAQQSDDYFSIEPYTKIDYTSEDYKDLAKDVCQASFKNMLKRRVFISGDEYGLLLIQNQIGTIKDQTPFNIWIEKQFGGNEFKFDRTIETCPKRIVKIGAPSLMQLAAERSLDTIKNATSIAQVKQMKAKLNAEIIELIIKTAHDTGILIEVVRGKNLQALKNLIEFGILPTEEYKEKFDEKSQKLFFDIETTDEIKELLRKHRK